MKIIAEIGWNHLGDMNLAKEMIVAASESGADFCKFQTWSVKNLKNGSWDNDGRKELYKKAELKYDDHIKLKECCEKNNIKFLTSIFNIKDIDFLKDLLDGTIKIGSPEVYNYELIKSCTENFETVLLSTGAAKWEEINKIKELPLLKKIVLMHCVSSYPCKAENINMPRMQELKKIVKIVGYSGHFAGIDDALIAIVNEAQYIEKHFTLDKNLPGKDNKLSIEPPELKKISEFRSMYQKMNKFKGLDIQDCEKDTLLTRGRWSK